MRSTDGDHIPRGVDVLEKRFGPLDAVKARIRNHRIETPSWAYSDSGTRFHVFPQEAAAKTPFERVQDAAVVHRFTGAAPTVALHLPWDNCEDWVALKAHAEEWNIRIGSINPNLFQDNDYHFGSLTNEDYTIRTKAIDHLLDCVESARSLGSSILSLWLPDGTNYPGQGDMRRRKSRILEGLRVVYAALPNTMRMLLEYKPFEPALYHTDVADWGMAAALCSHLGERAQVLVDLGHHPLGANIEHIAAFLISEGRLGGFHFNNRKYADDDVTVGSVNPFELFLIYNEVAAAEEDDSVRLDVAYMIDQAHNVKPKIEAMIQSVMACQEHYAKACLVDREALRDAQRNGDVIGAEEILHEAYRADVRPLLGQMRMEDGLDPNPMEAYRKSGYLAKVRAERSGHAEHH